MKPYVFRRVRLSIVRSLFTVHSAMVSVIQVCRQRSSRTRVEHQFHPGPARKLSTILCGKRDTTIKFANSPLCACRFSTGQKP